MKLRFLLGFLFLSIGLMSTSFAYCSDDVPKIEKQSTDLIGFDNADYAVVCPVAELCGSDYEFNYFGILPDGILVDKQSAEFYSVNYWLLYKKHLNRRIRNTNLDNPRDKISC